jgi:ribosome recycling factor
LVIFSSIGRNGSNCLSVRAKEEVQKLVDVANATLESLFSKKEDDILN